MKPIPKELQAYFPRAYDPARPWWINETQPGGLLGVSEWRRRGEDGYFTELYMADRERIDITDPLPPPQILVGQVWGVVGDKGIVTFEVFTVGTAQDKGGKVYAWGLNVTAPIADLIERGYLLRCPYGYAPWSGPETP